MGANSSKSTIQQYASKFEIRSKDDPKGLLYLIEKPTQKQFVYRKTSDDPTSKSLCRLLEKKKALSHQNIVVMREYLVTEGSPSSGLTSGALYEFTLRTLEDERIRKEQEQRTFDEKELWIILTGCVGGFSYFQRKSIQHCAVRSCNIFLDQNKSPRIADPYLLQADSNYQQYQKSPKGIYLSPNQLRSLRQSDEVPIHNPYKSDVFALGVIVLELTSMQLQDDLYVASKLVINQTLLAQRIEKLAKKYSPALKSVVSLMLEPIENQRVDWNELEIIMNTNQYKIYAKEKAPPQGRMSKEHRTNSKQTEIERYKHQYETGLEKQVKLELGQKILKYASFVGQSNYNSPRQPTPRSKPNDQRTQNQSSKHPSSAPGTEKVPSTAPITQLLLSNDRKPPTAGNIHGHRKQLSHAQINFQKPPPQKLRSYSPMLGTNKTSQSRGIEHHLQQGAINFAKIGGSLNTRKEQSPIRKRAESNLKPTISIVPMTQSEMDTNCVFNNMPKHEYIPKTIPDENLVEMTSRQSLSSLFSSNEDEMISEGYLKRIKKGKNRTDHKTNSQTTREILTYNGLPSQYMDFTKTSKGAFYSAKAIPQSRRRPPEPGMEFVKETYKQGAMYEGWKLRGLRHGTGRFLYFDGGLYDGEWVMNRMQGQGTLVYPNGHKAYQGKWVQDHFQGFGKLYNQEPKYIEKFNYSNFDNVQPYWDTYEGNFQQDLKHGFGVLVLSNGQIFEGYFKNDYVHGQGLFRGKGGIVKGRWQKNKLVTIL